MVESEASRGKALQVEPRLCLLAACCLLAAGGLQPAKIDNHEALEISSNR